MQLQRREGAERGWAGGFLEGYTKIADEIASKLAQKAIKSALEGAIPAKGRLCARCNFDISSSNIVSPRRLWPKEPLLLCELAQLSPAIELLEPFKTWKNYAERHEKEPKSIVDFEALELQRHLNFLAEKVKERMEGVFKEQVLKIKENIEHASDLECRAQWAFESYENAIEHVKVLRSGEFVHFLYVFVLCA